MNSPDMPDQGTDSFKKTVFATLTTIFGAGAAFIGMLGIIGLYFGISLLFSFFSGYKSIAFSASVIWIIFGSVLACHAATPLRGSVRTCTAAVVALIAILAALEFPLNILGKHFIVEIWSVQVADVFSAQPTTPISPVAVVLVVPAAIALFSMLYAYGPSKEEEQARNVVGILGLAISLVSFTFVLSYFYGAPFLYGTPLIPIDFTSAIAALLIGAGLVTAAGQRAIPLTYITGPSTRARLLRFFLPLTLIIILVQNFLMVTVTLYYNVNDALLLSLSIVIFSIVTTYVIAKVSGGVSYAIDRAERDRKVAENALRETKDYLEKLIRYANAPIIVWNPAFRITRFNDAFEHLTGRTEQEVLGQKIDILFPAESREASLALIKKTLEDERWEAVKIPILVSDGTIRTVLWNSANILTDKADLISTIAQGIDITELERAQEHLKESEERYHNIIEDQTESICRFLPDGTHVFVNDAYYRYFGIKREKIIGYRFRPDLHLDDRARVKDFFASLTPENPTGIIVQRINMPNGEVRWQRWSDRAIFDENGRVSEYQSVGRDITEQKQAEEALKESERRLHDIINFLPDPTYAIDADGRVIAWNRAIESLLEVPAHEVIGKGDYEHAYRMFGKRRPVLVDLVIHGDESVMKKHYPTLQKEGQMLTAELEIASLKGRRRVLWIIATPLYDAQGRVTGAIESMRDITHIRDTEHELQQLNAELEQRVRERTAELQLTSDALRVASNYNRSLFEADMDPLIMVRPDGTISDVNSAGERMTGISRTEIIGTHLSQYIKEPERAIAGFREVLEKGSSMGHEYEIKHRDGNVVPVMTNSVILKDDRGGIKGVFISLHDISKVKKDEELIRTQLREKEILLREIHHRVKNNLAGIISLIDLQIGSISDPAYISHLKDLEIQVRSMALVHESLYLTKDLTQINVATYTENLTRHLFQIYRTGTDIRCRIEMGDVTMPLETAIPCGLVMSEIVTNALKYAFPPTFSCVESRGEPCTITLTLHREGNDYLLRVADNGTGMPEGIDVTMSHSLGLYLIRFIVKHQLRGNLEISTAGGTSYTIRFPEPVHRE